VSYNYPVQYVPRLLLSPGKLNSLNAISYIHLYLIENYWVRTVTKI